MPNAFQREGSQGKPTRYAPLWTDRMSVGLWTQRSPLRDGATPWLYQKYIGSRYDTLIDGQNVEISNKLTLQRRPGTTVYNSQVFPPINRFYEFKIFNSQTEIIKVMADSDGVIWEATGPNTQTPILIKSGFINISSIFVTVSGLGTATFTDGISTAPIGSVVVISGNSASAANGIKIITASSAGQAQWQQAPGISSITGTGGVMSSGSNQSSGETGFQSVGNTLYMGDGVDNQKWVNTANTWLPNLAFNLGDFIIDIHGSIQVVTVAGTTGSTMPSWSTALGGTTIDGSITWVEHGPSVMKWGLNTPLTAPTVTLEHPGFTIANAVTSTITTITEVSTTATATTSTPHGAQPGQVIQIAGNSVSGYNGNIFIATVPSPTTFTFTATAALGTGNGGTASLYGYFTPGNTAQNTFYVNTVNAYSGFSLNQPVFFTGATPLAQATNPYVASVNGARSLVIGFSNILQISGAGGGTVYANDQPGGLTTLFGRQIAFSFKNSVTGHISTASPLASIPAVGTQAFTVTAPKSIQPQVDSVIVWATLDGGATLFQVAEVLPSVYYPAVTNWTATVNIPDTQFNVFVSAPINHANDPPPVGITNMAYHLGRIFGIVGNTVYYSGTNPQTVGVGAESFPPLQSFVYPSKVVRLVPLPTGLLVFTVSDVYAIVGTTTLISVPFLRGIGLQSYNALTVNGSVIYMHTSDGQLIELNPSSGVSEDGFPIGDIIETNLKPGESYCTWHVGGSQDKALYFADGSTGWFRMNPTSAPETGLSWSPFAAITGGCSAVQSVETVPGTHTLLVGPPVSGGPILQRDVNVFTDNQMAYTCFGTVGSIVLAQPGQVADVEFITTDCMAVGSHPTVSVLLDEIKGTFELLKASVPDPPQLVPSTTTYADRWYLIQKGTSAECRHLQVQFAWPAEAFKNELLTYTLFGAQRQEK